MSVGDNSVVKRLTIASSKLLSSLSIIMETYTKIKVVIYLTTPQYLLAYKLTNELLRNTVRVQGLP